jgi:pyruvate dehydrogenase E2 component (dihydrolipoamide acetyltransferase)
MSPSDLADEVLIPEIGDFKDVRVVELLVKVGEAVAKDAPLITLETDKATMDVPSPAAGTVLALRVAVGDIVSRGSAILQLARTASTPAPTAPTPTAPATSTPEAAATAAPLQIQALESVVAVRAPLPVRASPAVRKAARERGIDLSRVAATGLGGRLRREDLEQHGQAAPGIGSGLPAWPQVDYAAYGPVERKPLSRLKRIAGANLARNWLTIPHVTNFDEADITDLEAFRAQVNREQGAGGTKLTMLAFLIKASVAVLQRHPTFNASLDGENLVLKRYFHIGFAADTPEGLVVPVIRDADRKGLLQIARETASLAAQAREGKLKLADLQGGCFTISSLGGIGGTGFTPIINAPEVAILGATKAQMRPVWDGEQFRPRLMLPLGLSWDHRVIDGAAAARFLVDLAALLVDFRRALL